MEEGEEGRLSRTYALVPFKARWQIRTPLADALSRDERATRRTTSRPIWQVSVVPVGSDRTSSAEHCCNIVQCRRRVKLAVLRACAIPQAIRVLISRKHIVRFSACSMPRSRGKLVCSVPAHLLEIHPTMICPTLSRSLHSPALRGTATEAPRDARVVFSPSLGASGAILRRRVASQGLASGVLCPRGLILYASARSCLLVPLFSFASFTLRPHHQNVDASLRMVTPQHEPTRKRSQPQSCPCLTPFPDLPSLPPCRPSRHSRRLTTRSVPIPRRSCPC